MSLVKNISDAVVKQLNSRSWGMSFSAQRRYVIRLDLKDCEQLQVSVAPMETGSSWETRSSRAKTVSVGIAIQKKLNRNTEDDEINALLDLCEEIEQEFTGWNVEELNFYCEDVEHDPLYDWEQIRQKMFFVAALTLSFKGRVAR